jgi:hypothetical protein
MRRAVVLERRKPPRPAPTPSTISRSAGTNGRSRFRKCDPNGDGVIEKNEFALLNNFYWIMYGQR